MSKSFIFNNLTFDAVPPPEETNLILPLISVSGLPRLSLWDPSEALFSALNRHAENGDVQTAVSVLLVLGEQRANQIEEAKQEQWFLGYIELLNRHQLWNTATQVICIVSKA
jgi:WD repeat-containing protein 24